MPDAQSVKQHHLTQRKMLDCGRVRAAVIYPRAYRGCRGQHNSLCTSFIAFPASFFFPLLRWVSHSFPPSPCLAWLLLAAKKSRGMLAASSAQRGASASPGADPALRALPGPKNGAVKRVKSKYPSIKLAVKRKESSKLFSRENMCCVSNPPGSYHSRIILYTHTYRYLCLIMLQSPRHSLESIFLARRSTLWSAEAPNTQQFIPGW